MKRTKSVKLFRGKSSNAMKSVKSSASSTSLLSSPLSPSAKQPQNTPSAKQITRAKSKKLAFAQEESKQKEVDGERVEPEAKPEPQNRIPQGRDELLDESKSMLISTEEKLQKYITDMRIEALFVEVVEELLVHAPENPVKFILDYIADTFPNQAQESSYVKTFARPLAIGAGIPLTGVSASNDDYVPLSSDSEADSTSDDESLSGGVRPTTEEGEQQAEEKKDMGRARKRRNAVLVPESRVTSAHTNTPNAAKLEPSGKTLNMLRAHFMLSKFSPEVLRSVACAMSLTVFDQGHVLFAQGEANHRVYFIQAGSVELLVDDVVITTVFEGESVGSMILVGDTSAKESARVSSETAELLHISLRDYTSALRSATQRELDSRVETLHKCALFATFTSNEMETLAAAFEYAQFTKGEILFREHETSRKMFIIDEGEAMCTQQISSTSPEESVVAFTTGDVFGESALFAPRPRAATVKAASKVLHCHVLTSTKFQRLFGQLVPMIGRDKERFKRFVADKL